MARQTKTKAGKAKMEAKAAKAMRREKERAKAETRTKEKVKAKPKVMVLNKTNNGAIPKGHQQLYRKNRASTELDASSCAAGWQGKPMVAHMFIRAMRYNRQKMR